MSTVINEIIEEIERGYDGDPWHGPSLLSLLVDIDYKQAAAPPAAGSHSIAELAVHAASWKEIVAERLYSIEPIVVTPERDWPAPECDSADDWRAILMRLETAQHRLIAAIAKFDPSRLGEIVPGKQHAFAIELRGLPQHDAYHGGQIAILKRALAG